MFKCYRSRLDGDVGAVEKDKTSGRKDVSPRQATETLLVPLLAVGLKMEISGMRLVACMTMQHDHPIDARGRAV